ncbi:MAG: FixH family protein [Silicimonas sp.]|nr:FixH family protein [Silicimonas sp.]
MFRAFLTVAAALYADAAGAEGTYALRSDAGTYEIELVPDDTGVTLGDLHHWHLLLKDADGNEVDGASVTVDGGMPAHGHGLPTAPKVVDAGEAGHYLIEGLRFNMPGKWELRFSIEGAEGTDTATLEFGL